jgi:hypothetical protein
MKVSSLSPCGEGWGEGFRSFDRANPSPGSHLAMRHSRSFASAFCLRTAAKGGLCLSRKGEVDRALDPNSQFQPHLSIPAVNKSSGSYIISIPRVRDKREAFARRGRGERRVLDTPAASRAKKTKHTSVVTTSPPVQPGVPAREWFTACFALSLVNRAFLPPSQRDAKHHRWLTPASGRQDHTTSPSASPRRSSFGMVASTASRTNVRDDRDTPLFLGCGMAGDMPLICGRDQSRGSATQWHDGQITCRTRKPVK